MNMKKFTLLMLAGGLAFTSCKKEEEEEMMPNPTPPTQKTVDVSISGLEDLGSNYVYEGWLIVNGTPVSTGTFTVNGSGVMSQTSFNISDDAAANGTKFVLTIEPTNDPDPAPSDVHLVGGDFTSGSATLSVGDMAALGNDYSSSAGSFILATPTDGAGTNETSGVWFLDPSGAPDPSLTLPTLPAGWEYEGWAVIDGVPVTTGKFTDVALADNSAPYSGASAAPPFPGEDFLMNAPTGLTFPTDLSDRTIVISIEPVPDNDAAPFLLKPLVGMAPASATTGTSYAMGQNLPSLPTGTASIQ